MWRNLAIVLGNSHHPDAIKPLKELLQNKNLELRTTAAWALGQINHPRSKTTLNIHLANESEPFVVEEINKSLQRLG